MKQIFTTAAVMLAMMTANAADFTVYNDGELTAGLSAEGWWNVAMDFTSNNPDGEGKVFSFKSADGGADASMGLKLPAGNNIIGKLCNATLNFDWYPTGTGTYTIRLTSSAEQDYTFAVTDADLNKWHTTSIDVATNFPQVAAGWKEYKKKGEGYVFGPIVANGAANAVMYFNNIYYSNIDENWTAPEIPDPVPPTTVPGATTPAEDVISVFGSSYTPAASINIGGWGQATQASIVEIDGKEVYKFTNFNYLGWELTPHLNVTDYTYMHVDFYPTDETKFGFTPISPGLEKSWIAPEVKTNEWNSYDVPMSYFGINNADVFQIKFDQGNDYMVECYVTNVYFYKKNETPIDPIDPNGQTFKGSVTGSVSQTMNDETKEYPYTINYSITYNEDKTLTVIAKYDFPNGEPVGAVNGSILLDGVHYESTLENGIRTTNINKEFNGGEKLNIIFFIPIALGTMETPVEYVVGSESDGPTVGVRAIETAEDEVEYYNLQGVRVANPENGIFIRRQGNKVAKVIL